MTCDVINDESAETAAIFGRLRELKASFGPKPNKHDLAITLISACILEGLDTGVRIVRALRTIGLDYQHIAILLKEGTGTDPTAHRWSCDSAGRYRLLE